MKHLKTKIEELVNEYKETKRKEELWSLQIKKIKGSKITDYVNRISEDLELINDYGTSLSIKLGNSTYTILNLNNNEYKIQMGWSYDRALKDGYGKEYLDKVQEIMGYMTKILQEKKDNMDVDERLDAQKEIWYNQRQTIKNNLLNLIYSIYLDELDNPYGIVTKNVIRRHINSKVGTVEFNNVMYIPNTQKQGRLQLRLLTTDGYIIQHEYQRYNLKTVMDSLIPDITWSEFLQMVE